MFDLGIAIPTYSGHLYNLKNLLDQISKSTVLPKQVSVSISSFDGLLELPTYPFELIIDKHSESKNTSENLNISASNLKTNIITFMGGDDIPHIRRNEYLINSIIRGAKVIVHNYTFADKSFTEYTNDVGCLDLHVDYIDTFISNEHFPVSSENPNLVFANGPITLTNDIFEKFKYGETFEYNGREDSMYNSNLVKNGYKISYIKNSLMLYIK